MQSGQYDALFKFITLGAQGVGKSALIHTHLNNEFSTVESSNSNDFKLNTNKLADSIIIKEQIWDVPEAKKNASELDYLPGMHGLILCFDITNKESFIKLNELLDFAKRRLKYNSNQPVIVVGMKSDDLENRAVSAESAQEFSNTIGADYIEVSAVTNTNIAKVFETLSRKIINTSPYQKQLKVRLEKADEQIKKLENQNNNNAQPQNEVIVQAPAPTLTNLEILAKVKSKIAMYKSELQRELYMHDKGSQEYLVLEKRYNNFQLISKMLDSSSMSLPDILTTAIGLVEDKANSKTFSFSRLFSLNTKAAMNKDREFLQGLVTELKSFPHPLTKNLKCPLTKKSFEDPVILAESGITYERKALEIHLKMNPGFEPTTKEKLLAKPKLIANRVLKEITHLLGSLTAADKIDNAAYKKIDDEQLCPISIEPMGSPVIVPKSGIHYDKSYIDQWLKTNNIDPKTRANLENDKSLVVDNTLKAFISDWQEQKLKHAPIEKDDHKIKLESNDNNKRPSQ